MKRTGVTAVISAAHYSKSGVLHGHSYRVTAWFSAGDADALRASLVAALAPFEHGVLPDALAWGENLAEHIGGLLPGCSGVDVARPLEGIESQWRAE